MFLILDSYSFDSNQNNFIRMSQIYHIWSIINPNQGGQLVICPDVITKGFNFKPRNISNWSIINMFLTLKFNFLLTCRNFNGTVKQKLLFI